MSEPTPIGVPAGLRGLAAHDPGIIDDLRTMRESLEARTSLDEATIELVRLGTLVALRAPAGSFAAHVTRLLANGATPDDVWGAVLAVAPLVGVPALISAVPAIEAALGEADPGAGVERDGDAGAGRDAEGATAATEEA